MAQAGAVSTTTIVTIRREDPAADISAAFSRSIGELQDLARAVSLMKSDLKPSWPYPATQTASVANAYAALMLEAARVADELVGSVIRTGDAVLGILTDREVKNSCSSVRDTVQNNWSCLFTAHADEHCEEAFPFGRDDWTKRIVDTLRAVQARRIVAAA